MELTVEELRSLVTQRIRLDEVLPAATRVLRRSPIIHSDGYDAALLIDVLDVPTDFLRDHPDLLADLRDLAERNTDPRQSVRSAVHRFLARTAD
ncbi:hypothetical protein EV193_111156 [Herbihabitans rhizosphaerae]|uniref:Uncharacterized protein n=1 Tax=Herbihabitans rhizosphaerae TaxID=1872711 RepID=A0A4Q7KF89_9PSEU|nr:contact-dependent growth inhibition system immunity protein [Herbihabitans rhizosphaerae]RZS32771.1 hypothetical protein EV193_111156 [Herbihabitans rhizosphaerae]